MKKILLVEDTAHLAEEIVDILTLEGFDVRVAINGIQGLEFLKEALVDLIVTDLLMPGMDGFELIRQVRGNAKTKTIPIIVLSAKRADEDRSLTKELGANGFVSKPCKAHELLAAINSALV
jgi:DNA-binding response OmpR family regulator